MSQINSSSFRNENKPAEGLIAQIVSTLIDNQNYLEIQRPTQFHEEWLDLLTAKKEDMVIDFSVNNPFNMVMGIKYAPFMDIEDDLNVARIIFGIKDKHRDYRNCSIGLGIYMGRLFIGDIFDGTSIPKDKLVNGIHLIFTAGELDNGKCLVNLKAVDHHGLTLASLKSNSYSANEWEGIVSPGAHIKFLRIEEA